MVLIKILQSERYKFKLRFLEKEASFRKRLLITVFANIVGRIPVYT